MKLVTNLAIHSSWAVSNMLGEHVADCRDLSAAVVLVSLYGNGATIQFRDNTVWTEGLDGNAEQKALIDVENIVGIRMSRKSV